MTDDLVTWLRAQLDDDERDAQAQLDAFRRTHGDAALVFEMTEGPRWSSVVQARRVLAEVDAKRRILDQHDAMRAGVEAAEETILAGAARVPLGAYAFAVKCLALPCAGRPGYREEWKP